MLLKLATFHQGGPFRDDIEGGQFIEWYARAMEQKMKSAIMPDVLMQRRLHGNNMGIQQKDEHQDCARVIGDVLRDHRRSRLSDA